MVVDEYALSAMAHKDEDPNRLMLRELQQKHNLSMSSHENVDGCAKRIKAPGCSLSTHRTDVLQFSHLHHGLQICPSQQSFARFCGFGCSFFSAGGPHCSPSRGSPVTAPQPRRVGCWCCLSRRVQLQLGRCCLGRG